MRRNGHSTVSSFRGIRKRKRNPLVPVLASGRARKKHKKVPPICLVAAKPNNVLSSVDMSVKRKGSYMSRLPFIAFAVLVKERKMLLSFYFISRRITKSVLHNIQGTNIQSKNLHRTL